MRTDAPEQMQMTFGDHLEELRRRIILALAGVGVIAVGTFAFGFHIIAWLARPYLDAQRALGYTPQLYAFDFSAGFTTYMKVSLIAAVVLASPWVLYQAWLFVAAGLYAHERRAVYLLWPFSAVMTLLGVLFAYYILLPTSIVFFLNIAAFYPKISDSEPGFMTRIITGGGIRATQPATHDGPPLQLPSLAADPPSPREGELWINVREGRLKAFVDGKPRVIALQADSMLTPYPDIHRYVTSAAMIGLGVVIAFQLPVAMFVLAWMGLVDPAWISRYRKYAVFICVVAAAVLTPADVLSMALLFVPLYTLFEFGLLLMHRTYRRSDEAS
jgi:sec-independent protein translocase protein TatC